MRHNVKAILNSSILFLSIICFLSCSSGNKQNINPSILEMYVSQFNEHDNELYIQHIPNDSAFNFLKENIPLFECPDKDIEKTYYFRWWTFRKHIKLTPDGYVITEFLPAMEHAGKHNTISCPAAHHIYEGRWMYNSKYLDDYLIFWFRKGGDPRYYSFWAADALLQYYKVKGDTSLLAELLPDLIKNYRAWETGWEGSEFIKSGQARLDPIGLFWQYDGYDGMEISIGGNGYRPTINSYMYGDAKAIAKIAEYFGETDIAKEFHNKAESLKQLVQNYLWDIEAEFFKTIPRVTKRSLSDSHSNIELNKHVDVRELHGYTPWYFNLPDQGFESAWKQVIDKNGFYAPYGLTTAEQRHPRFQISYAGSNCRWDGPSWPFATSITLTAMANLLYNYRQNYVTREDYFEILKDYSYSHKLKLKDGKVVPWIDENLNPYTGDWIARTMLINWGINEERGKDYNHSTYCDLIISGLIGIRPEMNNTVRVNPLIPTDQWDWFCLENVLVKGKKLTVLYDKTGSKYKKGKGFKIFINGKIVHSSVKVEDVIVEF